MKIQSSTINSAISSLEEVCNKFNFFQDFSNHLDTVRNKITKSEVMIPLIGEFDSGKTSLLNCLLKGDFLPTGIDPTTSTIYEIRFSSGKDLVEIYSSKDLIETFEDLSELKNKDLSKATIIKVFSSSKVLPKGILIVDTPGLSSDIHAHEKTVVDYTPQADALLLAVDSHQGFTSTTLNFLQTINVLDKRIFIILTKSDAKSPDEMQDLMKYAKNQLVIKPEKVISSSAKPCKVEDLKLLLEKIWQSKEEIVNENVRKELYNIGEEIIQNLNIQISSAKLDTAEIDTNINKTKKELNLLMERMNKEIQKSKDMIHDSKNRAVKSFENYMLGEVTSLVTIAFEETEKLENAFDAGIKRASQHAIKEVFQKDVESIIKDLASSIDDLARRVDVGPIPALGFIKFSSEIVKIFLLDSILPGGVFYAVLGRIGIKFATRWPFMSTLWNTISMPITEIIKSIGKVIARSFVEKQIKEAIGRATDAFSEEFSLVVRDFIARIETEIIERFSSSKRATLDSLESLKTEKIKKVDEFKTYIENLKSARRSVDDTMISLSK